MADMSWARAQDRPAAPQELARRLLAVAAGSTSIAVQWAVARLLGAPREIAGAAAQSLADAGLLRHGIALPALVAAARRGTDPVGGLELLARGERVPSSWSDYEARAARDEALEEAADALRRLPGAERSVTLADGDAPLTAAEALLEGLSHARIAVVAGREADDGALLLAVVNEGWIRAVLGCVAVTMSILPADDFLDRLAQSGLDESGAPDPPEATSEVALEPVFGGSDGRVLRRAGDYLDPFEEIARQSANNAVDVKKPESP
ncbi:MAG TPA: hypothetical protein VML96_13620 [Egibacteraceae bacterium]|nr:hypothetical protein [Egibacteraceae bacterium]